MPSGLNQTLFFFFFHLGIILIADGGDGFKIWRVAANILNKQSRTDDKGWCSSLGLGVWLTTPHHKK
jgi:hypothetical protein